MEWSCAKTDNEIAVYFGPFYKGVYKLLEEPFCHVCSHVGITTEDCTWHHALYEFDRVYAMGKYFPYARRAKDDLLSYHIWGLKKWRKYAIPLGNALALTVQNNYNELLESKLIVPVPLHPDKVKRRGYNQTLELAGVLSNCLKIPVLDVLIKTEDVDMRPLSWKERRDAVKGLYLINVDQKDQIQGKPIVLLDDVVTTGFTVSECSKILKESGAIRVNVLALGRDVI